MISVHSAANRVFFRGRWAALLQLLPALVVMVLLLLIPLAMLFVVSLWRFNPSGIFEATEPTIENYLRYLHDPYYRDVVGLTLQLGFVTAGVCLLLGYPLAYIFARTDIKFRNFFMFLLLTPLFVSVVVRSFGWIVITDRNGLINFLVVGLGGSQIKILYTMSAVVIGLANVYLTFMVMPIYSCLVNIPRSLEEAAQMLGANPLVTWFRVILPLSLPGIVAGWFLVFALTLSSYVQPAVLGGPSFSVMSTVLYTQLNSVLNWPFAAASGFLLLVIGLLAAFIPPLIVRRMMKLD